MNCKSDLYSLKPETLINLPRRPVCLQLMAEFDMLPHIREHSFLVMEVALYLGQNLLAAGVPLHLPLIEAGALLHDLGKTPCLGTGENHAEWGAKILEKRGYPEVAQIVRQHVFLDPPGLDHHLRREAELVNYADKRVLHTQVVTLNQRFADLKKRYGQNRPEHLARINAAELLAHTLEAKIFRPLAISPADLLKLNELRRQS